MSSKHYIAAFGCLAVVVTGCTQVPVERSRVENSAHVAVDCKDPPPGYRRPPGKWSPYDHPCTPPKPDCVEPPVGYVKQDVYSPYEVPCPRVVTVMPPPTAAGPGQQLGPAPGPAPGPSLAGGGGVSAASAGTDVGSVTDGVRSAARAGDVGAATNGGSGQSTSAGSGVGTTPGGGLSAGGGVGIGPDGTPHA